MIGLFLAQTGFTPGELESLEKFINSGAVQVMFVLLVISVLLNLSLLWIMQRSIVKMQAIQETTMKNAQLIVSENNKAQNQQESEALHLAREVMLDFTRQIKEELGKLTNGISTSSTRFEQITGDMYARLSAKEDETMEWDLMVRAYLEREDGLKQDLNGGINRVIAIGNGNGAAIGGLVSEFKTMLDGVRAFWTDELKRATQEIQRQYAARELFKTFNSGFSFPSENDCRWGSHVVQLRNTGISTIWRYPYRMGDVQMGKIAHGDQAWVIWDSGFPGWAAVRLVDMPEVYGFLDHTFASLEPSNSVS